MKDTDWRIQTERICLKGCATKKERKKSQSVHCVKEGNRLQNTDREDTKRNCLGGCVKKRKKERNPNRFTVSRMGTDCRMQSETQRICLEGCVITTHTQKKIPIGSLCQRGKQTAECRQREYTENTRPSPVGLQCEVQTAEHREKEFELFC